MRLTTTEAGFVDATPIKMGKLVDFFVGQNDFKEIFERIYVYNANTNDIQKMLIVSIIHSLFLSQNPIGLPYERFNFIYIALDACSKLLADDQKQPKNHAERPINICKILGIQIPNFFKIYAAKSMSELSELRNNLIHEGQNSMQPLGFDQDTAVKLVEISSLLRKLICRALMFVLIGKNNPSVRQYLDCPLDSRDICGLYF